MRPINELIIHCTATPADWRAGSKTSAKVSAIRQMHKNRGWSDIGYHHLIDRDGTVAKGRPIERIGAHVKGHNTGTIGVSLFGGHGSSENDRFEDNFTPEQDAALRAYIADMGAAGTAVGSLNDTAQLIVIGGAVVALLGLAWIARERIKKWAAGVR